jgi:hypothetical protein
MRIWVTCFVLLFGAAELLDWLQKFSMPLPIFILGGVFLAIASNYSKLSNLPFHPEYEEPELPTSDILKAVSAPASTPDTTSPRPISFTIQKPFKPGD